MTDTDPKDIMLSYCWNEKELCRKIRDSLTEKGFTVWLDIERMAGNLNSDVANAVENCKVFLSCVSSGYSTSENCESEYKFARQKNKLIVPVIVEKDFGMIGQIAFPMGNLLYVDFINMPYDIAFAELLRVLELKGVRPSGEEQDCGGQTPAKPRQEFAALEKLTSIADFKCDGLKSIATAENFIFVSKSDDKSKTDYFVYKFLYNPQDNGISLKQKTKIRAEKVTVAASMKSSMKYAVYAAIRKGGKSKIVELDFESLDEMKVINTQGLDPASAWVMDSYRDFLAIHDGKTLAIFNDNRIASLFPNNMECEELAITQDFVVVISHATKQPNVYKYADGSRLVEKLGSQCTFVGLHDSAALSGDILITWYNTQDKSALMSIKQGTMKMLNSSVEYFFPYAFLGEDKLVGLDYEEDDLLVMQLQ